MFRKLLGLVLLAMPLPAFAAATFFWTCESTTLGANDFSAGDTTATANGGVSISSSSPLKGSNSCLTTDNGDYYSFDTASITSTGEMSFAAMFRWATTAATNAAFSKPLGILDSGDNDRVGFANTTAPRARLTIQQQGSSARQLDLTGSLLAADTTYFLTGGFDIANDRRFIRIYDSSCALLEQVVDTSTDIAGDQPGNFNEIRVGNNSGATQVLRVDTVVITNDYDDPIIDACPWTSFYPTFTGALSAGTHGETTLQVTYTPDQPGTGYGVVCLNGHTASHAQIVAGLCDNGSGTQAAESTFTEAGVAGAGENATFTGLSPGTTYDVFATYVNTLGGAKATPSALADQSTEASTGGPVFDAGPTVTGIASGFTIAGEVDANATVYFAGLSPGATPPADCDALQALSGAALWFGSEAWSASAADSFDVTAANKPVRANGYVCATNGDGDSDVFPFESRDRLPRSGFALTTIASVSATGLCDLDDYFNPDCAVGDVFEYQDETNESADCAVIIGTDGDVEYTPVDPGDCDGRLSFPYSAQDVSNATDGLFTAPAGMFTTDDLIVTGNSPVLCEGPETDFVVLLEDEEMAPRNLVDLGACSDADVDSLVATVTDGTLPNGTSIQDDISWEGTPDTEDEAGTELEITVCDPFDDCDTYSFTVFVTDDAITAPDCVEDTASACIEALVAVRPWLDSGEQLTATFDYSPTVEADDIISQDPAASGTLSAFQPLQVVVSLGEACIVPNVQGLDDTATIAAIEDVCNFTAAPGVEAHHPSIAVGLTVSTTPAIGTQLFEDDAEILYHLSKGPAPPATCIPPGTRPPTLPGTLPPTLPICPDP